MSEITVVVITSLMSTVSAVITFILKDKLGKRGNIEQAMVIILRREYLRVYDTEYPNERNKMKELTEIYEVYTALGGNCTVTELHRQYLNNYKEEI